MCDFELGDTILCIKDYETIKSGNHYRINGSGDLTMNFSTDKNGYGFSIVGGEKTYYFTESEMVDYFISYDLERKYKQRDQKINKILS